MLHWQKFHGNSPVCFNMFIRSETISGWIWIFSFINQIILPVFINFITLCLWLNILRLVKISNKETVKGTKHERKNLKKSFLITKSFYNVSWFILFYLGFKKIQFYW